MTALKSHFILQNFACKMLNIWLPGDQNQLGDVGSTYKAVFPSGSMHFACF